MRDYKTEDAEDAAVRIVRRALAKLRRAKGKRGRPSKYGNTRSEFTQAQLDESLDLTRRKFAWVQKRWDDALAEARAKTDAEFDAKVAKDLDRERQKTERQASEDVKAFLVEVPVTGSV